MKPSSLLLGILFLAFASCKKNKDDDNCSLSAAALAGNYKITAVTYKASASSPEIDVFEQYAEPCSRDDVFTFNTNDTYTYADAGVACDPEGSEDGTWSLSGNTITLDGEQGIVENFTCNSFSLTQNEVLTGAKASIVYTRQ